MNGYDDFEQTIHAAGKAGAIQALAAVQTILSTLGSFSSSSTAAALMSRRGAGFATGWESFANVVGDIIGALHRQAVELPVMPGPKEGELVHLRPGMLDETIRSSLMKHLTSH